MSEPKATYTTTADAIKAELADVTRQRDETARQVDDLRQALDVATVNLHRLSGAVIGLQKALELIAHTHTKSP